MTWTGVRRVRASAVRDRGEARGAFLTNDVNLP